MRGDRLLREGRSPTPSGRNPGSVRANPTNRPCTNYQLPPNQLPTIGGWEGDTCTPTSTHTSKVDTHTSTHTSKQAPRLALSEAVRRLLSVIDGEMTRGGIMSALKLRNRSSFLEFYLLPALRIGFIEMTQPDSPRSPTQKYRLTEKGLSAKRGVE